MLNSKLHRRERADSIWTCSAAGGRNEAATYVAVWRRLCDALWHEELEDPLFRRAVELVEANHPEPGADARWLQREAWRGSIRYWWFSVRDCYASPAEIPQGWMVAQREWETKDELSLSLELAGAHSSGQRAATWARVEALIDTGAYWPLHLDAPHLLQAQFETLHEWAPAVPNRAAAQGRRRNRLLAAARVHPGGRLAPDCRELS
jgi:hypothetical protein